MKPSPLNALLSAALEDLTREAAGNGLDAVAFEVHANVLRHLQSRSLDARVIPTLACISKRAAHWNISVAERRVWVVARDKHLQLTREGRRARDAIERSVQGAENAWAECYGRAAITRLRAALEALVRQFDLELPHYPTGYGPADSSVTGGVAGRWGRRHALRAKGLPGLVFDPDAEHAAAEAWEEESGGRLYVRTPGQDWRPVARGEGDTVSALPLLALLSQALMAFAIDYEGCGGLAMARSGNVLRHIGNDGVEIELRAARSRGSPALMPADSTAAALARHAYAEVVPIDTRKGRLKLTEKGERVRDAYDDIVVAIERRWKRRYGASVVRELRSALLSVRSDEP